MFTDDGLVHVKTSNCGFFLLYVQPDIYRDFLRRLASLSPVLYLINTLRLWVVVCVLENSVHPIDCVCVRHFFILLSRFWYPRLESHIRLGAGLLCCCQTDYKQLPVEQKASILRKCVVRSLKTKNILFSQAIHIQVLWASIKQTVLREECGAS